MLEADRPDLALFGQHRGVAQRPVVFPPHGGKDEADGLVARFGHQLMRRREGVLNEARLEQQVLGKVARQEQLGKHDDVGAGAHRLRDRLAGKPEIVRERPDMRVELRQGYAKSIGHETSLA